MNAVFFVFTALVYLSGWLGDSLQQNMGKRYLNHNGSEVKTTFKVDDKFIGRYSGKKTGFLLLNADGTGVYKYDVYGFSKGDCKGGEVHFIWGFILDEKSEIVRFDRSYGYSYPIVYVSSGEAGFQDCTKKSLVDYLLVRRDGSIAVSSSDDWIKNTK